MVKTFVSPTKTFSFEYPDDWEFELENDDTIMLWKKSSQMTLRITPLSVEGKDYSPEKAIKLFHEKEKDLVFLKRNGLWILKSRKEGKQGKTSLVQDYWKIATKNRVFICSFTMIKSQENSIETNKEKMIAEKILYSIKLLK